MSGWICDYLVYHSRLVKITLLVAATLASLATAQARGVKRALDRHALLIGT